MRPLPFLLLLFWLKKACGQVCDTMTFFFLEFVHETVHSNSCSPSQRIYFFSYCSNSISISSAVSDECMLSNYCLIYNVELYMDGH